MHKASLSDLQRIVGWIERDSGVNASIGVEQLLTDPLHVFLIEGDGGAMFLWHGPGIYEVHVMFAQRGREVIELSHRMLKHMRAEYDAKIFWAAVPIISRHVVMFTRLMGWKPRGFADLPRGRCELFIGE